KSYVKADDLFKDFDIKLDNFENKYIIKNDKIEYPKKYFVTWTLKYDNDKMRTILSAKFKNDKIDQAETKSDSIQIVPEAYINSDRDAEKYVKVCDCLDNDDLVIVTARSVFIWTFNTKDYKIELNYRWDNGGYSWDWNGENRKEIINLFSKKSYFHPPSSYISMIRNNHAFPQSEPPKYD
ncbi:17405_t:CDS:2, partial [Gigaspora rosea]